MSSRKDSSPARWLVVWLVVTAAVLGTWSAVADAAASLASSAAWHGTFEDLLVAVASAALLICTGWLWLVTTATVLDLVRGRAPSAAPRGLTRRLVLMACGAVVVAGFGSPALAGSGSGSGSGDRSLVGLPMPDRAVVNTVVRADPQPAAASQPGAEPRPVSVARPTQRHTPLTPITVRAGDSLWSIAAAGLGPEAAVDQIDAAWRELYAANHDAIGPDPNLIRPGLTLEPGPNREARP